MESIHREAHGGKETKLAKALRLTREVEERGNGYAAGGHFLTVGEKDLACDCRASSFGQTCSHKMAVELYLARLSRSAA